MAAAGRSLRSSWAVLKARPASSPQAAAHDFQKSFLHWQTLSLEVQGLDCHILFVILETAENLLAGQAVYGLRWLSPRLSPAMFTSGLACMFDGQSFSMARQKHALGKQKRLEQKHALGKQKRLEEAQKEVEVDSQQDLPRQLRSTLPVCCSTGLPDGCRTGEGSRGLTI